MYRTAGGAQYFYQSDFGPAVMLACGRAFQDPDTRNAPALAAFLSQQSDSVDCASVPSTIETTPMNPFQRGVRYLEVAVALTWKITGVSWSRLDILPGALFGTVAALTYGVLRLALTRTIALAALVPERDVHSQFHAGTAAAGLCERAVPARRDPDHGLSSFSDRPAPDARLGCRRSPVRSWDWASVFEPIWRLPCCRSRSRWRFLFRRRCRFRLGSPRLSRISWRHS